LDDYVRPGESGKDFAKRVCDEKFGPGNYPTGQTSDYNRIKKRVDRDPNYKRISKER
jgi:RHS protein